MTSPDGRVYFGTADYVFLSIMLLGSMAIGVFFAVSGKKQSTKEDYLLGGRRLKALPVCLSLFATFMSAISLIGIPTEVYTYGTMYVYSNIGLTLSYILAMVTVVPLLYPLKLTSVYEYLNLRFQSRAVQLLGAVFGVMSTMSYMTIALLSPALALETAVGIPLWLSIVLVGAVGTIYTTIGGIKSVIWTDVFQTVIIYAGIFTVLVKGSMDAGGFDRVWQIGRETGRIDFDDARLDPRVRHTIPNLSIGMTFYWLAIHFQQSSVQRLVSTKSIHSASRVYLFTIPLVLVFTSVLLVTGLVLLAYFYEIGCDPLAAGYITNNNQLMPYFVIHTLVFLPGLSGLYIATIFSGALSTLSSGINSLAANTVQDFLASVLQYRSDFVVTTVTKILVCFFGIASTSLAYLAKDFDGPVTQVGYSAISATNGPLLGLFLLAGVFPQANYIGASIGFLSSVAFSFWHSIGSMWFGYSHEKLPMGPIDRCSNAENISSIMSTERYSVIPSKETTMAGSFEAVTSLTLTTGKMQEMGALRLEDKDFSLYDISYVYSPVMGAVVTVVIGLVTSLVTNCFLSKKLRPDAKFLFPFCRHFWYSDRNVLSTEMNSYNQSPGL